MIVLRSFEDTDVALLEKWLYAPHVAKWYQYPDHWLREIHTRRGEFSFITHFIALKEGVPIGFCQYYDTHFAQEHEVWNGEPQISDNKGEIYSIDYLIGEPAFLRKGYGSEIVRLLCEEVRKTGAKKIIVDPEEGNLASNKTLETTGFTHTGDHYVMELRKLWRCPRCGREFENAEQNHFCTEPPKTVEDYIALQAEDLQPRLREVYATIKAALPDATEKISWQMPTFWKGGNLIHFAAFKKHIGLYPGGEATAVFAGRLTGYKTSKGGIQLPNNKPLPLGLITEIALWCGENNAK